MGNDYGPVVPKGAMQRALTENRHGHLRTDIHIAQSARCVIVKVWDRDAIGASEVPDELASRWMTQPGLVFAEVRERASTQTRIVPFADSADVLYGVHGNSLVLEGQPAMMHYRSGSKDDAVLTMAANPSQPLSRTSDMNGVASIISMFG
jgi:hypothetical protein